MTPDEANRCLLVMLLFDRREWPTPQVEAWTHALTRCTDVHAAMTASRTLADTIDPRDWSLARWRDAYQDVLRRTTPALAERSDGPVVTLDQAMASLTRSEAGGDRDATRALVNLRRYKNGELFRGLTSWPRQPGAR